MVMSGESRLRYHAVPRILAAPQGRTAAEVEGNSPASPPLEGSVVEPVSEDDWVVCSRYIQSSRLNVTIRQVVGPGQSLAESPSPLQRTDEGQEGHYHDRLTGGEKRKRSSNDTAQT